MYATPRLLDERMDLVYARLSGILNLKRAARRVAAVEHREDD